MLALHDWQSFYTLTGTAAATLIGLLFVAISVASGLKLEQARNSLRTFVNPILIYYFQILLISCVAIMPLQNSLILVSTSAILSCVDVFLVLKVLWGIIFLDTRDDIGPGDWIWHVLFPLIAGGLFVLITVAFFQNQPLAPLGLAIAVLLYLSLGVRNSWVVMVWLILFRAQHEDQNVHKEISPLTTALTSSTSKKS